MQNNSNAAVLWRIKLWDMSRPSETTTDRTALRRKCKKIFLPPSDTAGNTVLSKGALQPQHYIIYTYIESCTKFCQGHWLFDVIHIASLYNAGCRIPAVARSKPCVCGHSLIRIASSNPARCTGVCLLRVLYVLSCTGVCYRLITHPGKSHRMRWV